MEHLLHPGPEPRAHRLRQPERVHLAEDGPPRRRGGRPLGAGERGQHLHQEGLLSIRHREPPLRVLEPEPGVEPGRQGEVGEELRVDVGRAVVEQEPVERVCSQRHRPVLEQRLQPRDAPAGERPGAAEGRLERLRQPEVPAPRGEEDGEPLHPALGAQTRDVREVEGEAHEGPQHREGQLLLACHPDRVVDLLGSSVEEAAVVQHHPNVGAGPGARALSWRTRVHERLMLSKLLFQARREPARLTETHDSCARPRTLPSEAPRPRRPDRMPWPFT
jgi:hypothetical protein